MNYKKINLFALTIFSVFFNSNTMDCPELCKTEKNYRKCLEACRLAQKYHISINIVSTESGARKEWDRRYPCPIGEESDCYRPYRGNYAEGIKNDNEQRARWDD